MRWVDDLLTIISTRAEMSSKTSDAIVSALCTAYTPFNLKLEDASVFVGFSLVIFDASTAPYIRSDIAIPRGIHFCNKGRTRAEIVSGSARLPHGLANLSKTQKKCIVKGCIIRDLDNASCEHMFLYTLWTIFLELESLKYPQGILRRALYDIGTRYVVVRQYVRVVAQWNARR